MPPTPAASRPDERSALAELPPSLRALAALGAQRRYRTNAVLIEDGAAPDIGWVARLGAVATSGPGALKPLYLRAPDAQPQAAARLPRR